MDQLNNDCIYNILLLVNTTDILNWSLINKQFLYCCSIEQLWKYKVSEIFDDYAKQNDWNWMETFKNNKQFLRIIKTQQFDIRSSTTNIFFHETFLNLANTQLMTIPDGITNLINLKHLYLQGNSLKVIPREIGNLINLVELHFHRNVIQTIPIEIGNLINLKELYLHSNEIQIIPKEIGKLINLKNLVASFNDIKVIPKEIGNLVNLETLYLRNNKIKEVPKELGNLIN